MAAAAGNDPHCGTLVCVRVCARAPSLGLERGRSDGSGDVCPISQPAPHPSVNLDVDVTTNRISRCWKREAYLCKCENFHLTPQLR